MNDMPWYSWLCLVPLLLFVLLLPLMWIATGVGERLGNRVSSDSFSRILALMLLASGVRLLLK